MRIKTLLLTGLLLSAVAAVNAQNENQANSLYREGKFEEAIPIYQELSSKNPDNPYLHYNLGNAYIKTNRLGKAVASHMRAFMLLPRDSDIRYNLAFSLKRAGEELVPAGVPAIAHRLYYMFSSSELSGIVWILVWLSCISLSALILGNNGKAFLKPLCTASCIALCFFGAWKLMRSQTEWSNVAVVAEGIAEVRGGPADTFGASATVPEGHIVDILDSKEEWYEVGIKKEGIRGWIKKSSLERI